jgi:hypothetical protein
MLIIERYVLFILTHVKTPNDEERQEWLLYLKTAIKRLKRNSLPVNNLEQSKLETIEE